MVRSNRRVFTSPSVAWVSGIDDGKIADLSMRLHFASKTLLMITWIFHRPPQSCHQAEIRVAERLKELEASPHDWTVIWGYYYQDARGIKREGDFLILGPAGGLLVLEVKSSLPRHFSETGRWEGSPDDDPIEQLMHEWKGVIQAIKSKGPAPFVEKALCVPSLGEIGAGEYIQGIQRNWLITGADLSPWLPTWLRIFDKKVEWKVTLEQKNAVLAAFGQGALPAEKRSFIEYTERFFEHQFTSRFSLLDQLADNRQLLVHGGAGTGKTWHALELAFRYARDGGGQRVLFLTYHKAFTTQLQRLVALRQLECGEVIVRGWEDLCLELCEMAGKPLLPPAASEGLEELRHFFEVRLPRQLLEISRCAELVEKWPSFDALVVDEAQDHDTMWHEEIASQPSEEGGWWQIYLRLLKHGRESRAGIFYDVAQRPPFRAAERFDPGLLARQWSQPAHVRLQPALRYTRPLWQFFRDHSSPHTQSMIDALGQGEHLPEGPEPELHRPIADQDALDLVESIIHRWRKSGLCDPSEILILHAQSDIAKSPIGARRVLAGRNLREWTEETEHPDCIRHTSIHKAKGLDSKAVILIGLPPHPELVTDYDHYSWFMAVSRARQLLAIVENPSLRH
ncbi:MAG: hypothetical protein EAZ81_12200 [Verrucomicrobia bacterium]|nr:MAG: hypothetical protein EAZ81_12200 [Verrucomicrobiota bacterium]